MKKKLLKKMVAVLLAGTMVMGLAGCGGDDGILLGEGVLIYAVNDGGKVVSGRSGNNYLLCAGVDMRLALCLRAVEAGALQNYIDSKLAPGKVGSLGHSVDCYLLAVNNDCAGSYDSLAILGINSRLAVYGVSVLANLSAVAALSGVVLEKVSEHLRLGEVVDSDNLVALCAEHLPEGKAADSAESVNSNFY